MAWPLASPFDQVYPAYPGGTDVAAGANVAARGESALLALGMQYQARTGFHRLRPPDL